MSRTRRALQIAGAAAVVLSGFGVVRWWESQPRGEPLVADIEIEELADVQRMTAAVHLARAHVLGETPDVPASLEAVPGRSAYVCAYGLPAGPSCAEGDGLTLAGSVIAAADAVAALPPAWSAAAARIRIKLDVVQHSETVRWPRDERVMALGVDGFVDPLGGGYLLPSELLEGRLHAEDRHIPVEALSEGFSRRGAPLDDDTPTLQRIRTASWVEAEPGGAVVRVYRLHPYEQPDGSDADLLLQSAVWAADHLASSISADGRIRYVYDPVYAEIPGGYNKLRHAGTTYSLIQAWDRVRVDAWREAAHAAIDWLLTQSRRDVREGPYGGGEVQYVLEGSHLKLGGAGLALVMLATWQAATGDDSYADDAQAFARFLVSQQQESGEFVYFAPLKPGGEPRDQTSAYYPGEAILGLVLWHHLDPQPVWLETAVRGADWLIDVRDAGKGASQLANDHWLMIALSHLYEVTGDDRYVTHSLALVDAVAWQAEKTARWVDRYPDYAGGYYQPPRSTPAATRGEGLVAVLDTCALAGKDCAHVQPLLTATISHVLQSQYTPEVLWWVEQPHVAFGGFSGGIVDTAIRNDFTQHAMSAVLGTERHLRTDRVLPGGPGWSAEESAGYPGVPAPVVRSLRERSLELRGPTPWDLRAASAPDRGAAEATPSGVEAP